MPPDLPFYPLLYQRETGTRVTDPKVVHPATENGIDFRNHKFDGPTDILMEDFLERRKKRSPLLQLGGIVWPPLSLKAENAPKLKAQEGEALSLFQINHPTLVLVDRNV